MTTSSVRQQLAEMMGTATPKPRKADRVDNEECV